MILTKHEAREWFRGRRQLTDGEADRAIVENFFRCTDLSAVRYLHCFLTIAKLNEVDTRPLLEKVWNEHPHITTVVPRVVDASGKMVNVVYHAGTPTADSRWNIPEPVGGVEVESELLDVVVVPLLAIDRFGHRVGYGKGFYDRLLARCRPECRKIGLSRFEPIARISDVNEFDIPLDAAALPDRFIEF